MAKTAKRLNAILDYMKKVKSSISMVSHPPTPGLMICQTSLCGLTFRYMYHYVWVLVVIKGQRGQGRGRLIYGAWPHPQVERVTVKF